MKPLVAYVSRTGNTVRVAEVVARELGADLRTADEVGEAELAGRALVGLGSGVYWLGHDRRLRALADRLPSTVRVFTVTTSGFRWRWLVRLYLWRIRRRLTRRGIEVVGQLHCPGQDRFPPFRWLKLSQGRPDERDLAAAATFARALRPPGPPTD